MTTILRSSLIVLTAMAIGLAANLVRSHPIPWTEQWSLRIEAQAAKEGLDTVDTAQAKQIVEARNHLIFDARPSTEFAAGHLFGALSVPIHDGNASLEEVQALLTPDKLILVYCSGRQCEDSLSLARILRSQGFQNVKIFVGGFEAWVKAGLKVERDS